MKAVRVFVFVGFVFFCVVIAVYFSNQNLSTTDSDASTLRNFACSKQSFKCPNGQNSKQDSKGCFSLCQPLCSTDEECTKNTPVEDLMCTADVKLCEDGTYVARDPKNNCQFKNCPTIGNPAQSKCFGDLNKDGKIDRSDFSAFRTLYKKSCSIFGVQERDKCEPLDSNSDGKIDFVDFSNFIKNFVRKSC